MFVHQTQLRHLLEPADYCDEERHRLELDRLFRPGWHVLGTTAEVPRPGDFLTRELLGRPLLLRNCDGTFHAFLNVCAHRHCLLTHEPKGWAPTLRCQYHGWEFKPDGRTGRIPDAQCFRPFDRDNAHLRQFRTETRGQLIFVCLEDNGVSLDDYLGPFAEECRHWFAPPFRQAWVWQTDYNANWKIILENSLESYHVPCLHQKSFGIMPAEAACQHELADRHTTFRTVETFSWISAIQNMMVHSLGQPTTNIYTHHHAHPNMTFVSMDVLRMIHMLQPTSATTCRHRIWLYSLRGFRKNPWAWLIAKILSAFVVRVARQITFEDAGIFADVQKGLEASDFPGVIGTREERVWAFQRFLLSACGREPAPCNRQECTN
jgi:phenylpropionate dioxygenase-like ring-hydroxylating dioxygenase large terminal subunit